MVDACRVVTFLENAFLPQFSSLVWFLGFLLLEPHFNQ
jgi:hypothetical protein